MAIALKENTSLEYLNIEWNDIHSEGLKAIVKSLKENKDSKLKVLDVHSNKIEEDGAIVCIIILILFFINYFIQRHLVNILLQILN